MTHTVWLLGPLIYDPAFITAAGSAASVGVDCSDVVPWSDPALPNVASAIKILKAEGVPVTGTALDGLSTAYVVVHVLKSIQGTDHACVGDGGLQGAQEAVQRALDGADLLLRARVSSREHESGVLVRRSVGRQVEGAHPQASHPASQRSGSVGHYSEGADVLNGAIIGIFTSGGACAVFAVFA